MPFIYHFTNQWLQCDCANTSLIFQLNQLKSHSGKFTLKMYDEGGSILLAARAEGSVTAVTKNSIRGYYINNSQIVQWQVQKRAAGIDYSTPSCCISTMQPASVSLRPCSGGTCDRKWSWRSICRCWPCVLACMQEPSDLLADPRSGCAGRARQASPLLHTLPLTFNIWFESFRVAT